MSTDWNALAESGLTREERRRGGVFNTPLTVAVDAVASVIDRVGTVCDPSCGAGTFLVAAGERLVSAFGLTRAEAAALLVGVDVDARSVAIARARLAEWSGGAPVRVMVGDGLAFDEPCDFVVGNPPFVDRLHVRFLEHALRIGGAVAMIVPVSVLATREGRAARSAGFGVVSMTRLGPVFDASVDTCVLVLRRDAPVPPGPTWSSLLVSPGDVPEVSLLDGAALGSWCEVVAGFRQHFYGLRGHVREGSGGGDELALVTSGSIEPGSWRGAQGRTVRFDGLRYTDPVVDLDAVDEPVRSWFAALLRPKVVVATQTRVIEAAADVGGVVVPSVPVISVLPAGGAHERVWRALAVLLAPPVSAWAIRSWGGSALTASTVKLGAPQVRSVPCPGPAGARAWGAAASVLAGGGSVVEAGRLMCEAYGVDEEVHAWWAGRLR